MSAKKEVTIWCDAPKCIRWIAGLSRLAKQARVFARSQGWARRNGQDLCPQCAAEGQR